MADDAGELARLAADPRTPLTTLQQLAQEHPELRAAVAANPSTYPALVEWLGRLGMPDVDAALARRAQPAAPAGEPGPA
ncbi:variant leucine-rich repeat-containing protein, partial [Georgenia subflava]